MGRKGIDDYKMRLAKRDRKHERGKRRLEDEEDWVALKRGR